MSVYKDDKRGTWYVSITVTRDKKKIRKTKRGFLSYKDARDWERRFIENIDKPKDMKFDDLMETYFEDLEGRLRRSSIINKESIIRTKILPFFSGRNVYDISAADIREWQTRMLRSGFAQTYLRSIQEQMSAMMNFAVRYYDLPKNPCLTAGPMGKGNADEMEIWTIEEFMKFSAVLVKRPDILMAYTILFWTGMRLGEMLALNVGDVNLANKTISITKSLQRIHGVDIITEPKTPKSKRVVALPDVLVEQLEKYIKDLDDASANARLILVTKNVLENRIHEAARVAGVKEIHIHCLRHSHTALIASLGATPVEAAERLGHENVQTTLNIYSHVLPQWDTKLMQGIDEEYRRRVDTKEDSGDEDDSV